MRRYRIGILGSTGLVGQRLVERLTSHPWFEPGALAASGRSSGRRYGEVVRWRGGADPPQDVLEEVVRPCEADQFDDCDGVFSALEREVAEEIEPRLADRGLAVVSNASALRMEQDVPLLVPEINPEHLDLLATQRADRGWGGYVVTNPNCSTTGLALALAPLHREFGVRRVVVSTLQAVSGAGSHGPSALDLIDNVLPWIPGEEEKIERELGKILGDARQPATVDVAAHCHRVPVIDGHLEAVSVELQQPATPTQAVEVLRAWTGQAAALDLPSAPARPIVVRTEADRPQPRLDRDAGGGMSVVVGRVRACPVLSLRFLLLSHNTVRGAAGGTLLNGELLAARRLLPRRAPA
jgi:aspartate-semialdehyde dehydrogenase